MKMKLFVGILACGLLASSSSTIASQETSQRQPKTKVGAELHWWSRNPSDVNTASPPLEGLPQWYLKLYVNEKCGNVPCGDIRITNCLMLFQLSAGQQGICQFADSKKHVTWYAANSNSSSAGKSEYIQLSK